MLFGLQLSWLRAGSGCGHGGLMCWGVEIRVFKGIEGTCRALRPNEKWCES